MAEEIAHAAVDRVYATAVAHPRATPPAEVVAALHRVAGPQWGGPPLGAWTPPHLDVIPTADTRSAIASALDDATPRDLVCVAGSLYLAGEALRAFAARSEVARDLIEIAGVDH